MPGSREVKLQLNEMQPTMPPAMSRTLALLGLDPMRIWVKFTQQAGAAAGSVRANLSTSDYLCTVEFTRAGLRPSTIQHETRHVMQLAWDVLREAAALKLPRTPTVRQVVEGRHRVRVRVAEAWGALLSEDAAVYTPAYSDFPLAGGPPRRALSRYAHSAAARAPSRTRGARDSGSGAAERMGRAHEDYDTEAQTDLADVLAHHLDVIRVYLRDGVGEDRTTREVINYLLTRPGSPLVHWRTAHPARFRWAIGVLSNELRKMYRDAHPVLRSVSTRVKLHNYMAAKRERARAELHAREARERHQAEARAKAEAAEAARLHREEIQRQRKIADRKAATAQRKAAYAAKVERFKKRK